MGEDPELEARNPSLRAAGGRMALNLPIQGPAAAIMNVAMLRVDEALDRGGPAARRLPQCQHPPVFHLPPGQI